MSPDQLFAGLSRVRAEQGASSSIPPTPAPTPNPLLQVHQHMVPEQLVAGIKGIKVDEGYIDSTSFPGEFEICEMYLPKRLLQLYFLF